MIKHLRHDLKLLYESLLSGKLPRSLNWSDTVELVGQLGVVEPHGNDDFVFIFGTQRELFKRPHNHELGVDEVSRLRKLLKASGPVEGPPVFSQPSCVVVVIDHHGAHIYQDLGGSRTEEEKTIRPHDPFNFHHHLVHRKEAHYNGERVPEEPAFYEEIAQALVSANEIVLVGHGTGKSSAVDHLTEFLKIHHQAVSLRVKAVERVDLSAVTEPQIEEIAKRHMIAVV